MKKKLAAFCLAAAMLTACGADNVTNSSEVSETQSESVSETTAESVSETESETVSETEASEETQSETVTETTTETVSETEPETVPETEAEPEPADYRALYKEKLMSCIGEDEFFDLYDVNSDGVPELFITERQIKASTTSIYIVVDDELVQLKAKSQSDEGSEISEFGVYAVVGISDEGIFDNTFTDMYTIHYDYLKLENNRLEPVFRGKYVHDEPGTPEGYEAYYIEGEEVTLEEFNEAVSPYESLNWSYVGYEYELNEETINSVLSEDYLPVENT